MFAATEWTAPRLYDGLETELVADGEGVVIMGAMGEGEVTDFVAEEGLEGLF